MRTIDDVETLEALYGQPSQAALKKVVGHVTPLYRRWIEASRFCILATAGPDGTDATPRGDDGPVARVVGENTLWMPDWRGNNRLDSLRNIVRDGRVTLMFMVPGSNTVVRVNGSAVLTADTGMTESFGREGHYPRTVIVVSVAEVYFQCAKALMRADLWSRDDASRVPTAGQFLKERDESFDADSYAIGYEDDARSRIW